MSNSETVVITHVHAHHSMNLQLLIQFWFVLLLYVQFNSYGDVMSPNDTFFLEQGSS